MTFDLQRLFDSKRSHRQALAGKPIAEKLRMLDSLRERELAIRGPTRKSAAHVAEPRATYRTDKP